MLGRECLEVLVNRLIPEPASDGAKHSRHAGAVELRDELLALALGAKHVGHPVPLAVGEEAGVRDDDRARDAGVVARPAQADQPAPVVEHEGDAVEPQRNAKALHRLDLALPRAGEVRRRVAVAGQVGGDRAPPRAGERREHVAPHV